MAMAETLDDAEFWLPSQFLTDDDILMDVIKSSKCDNKATLGFGFLSEPDASKPLFPFEFPFGFGSSGVTYDQSSPGESVLGCSETESDEEDFMVGLTRQMARSTLEDCFKKTDVVSDSINKHQVVSGSPQSTLCAVGSGCLCGQGSSRGSPNSKSRVSSPPATWDLLHAAADEVAKMRLNKEGYQLFQNRGLLGPPRKPSPVSAPLNKSDIDVGYYLYQSLSQKQLQAQKFQQLRHQHMIKQQSSAICGGQMKSMGRYQVTQNHPMAPNTGRNNENICSSNNRPLGLSSSAWPSLQQSQPHIQKNVSGMKTVFLGNPGSKRESTGTGVFLPRNIGNQHDTRRKQTCSTVLVPARVAQALNLNLDEMCEQPPSHSLFNGKFVSESDIALRLGVNNAYSHQKRNYMRPQHQTQVVNHEIRLPQEWTY